MRQADDSRIRAKLFGGMSSLLNDAADDQEKVKLQEQIAEIGEEAEELYKVQEMMRNEMNALKNVSEECISNTEIYRKEAEEARERVLNF